MFLSHPSTGVENFPHIHFLAVADSVLTVFRLAFYSFSCVSLAGIFLLLRGKANVHIIPEYPEKSFNSIDEVRWTVICFRAFFSAIHPKDVFQVEKWFQIFNVSAPLVCVSVLHSYDPGYKLRIQHTHCYSDHEDAG